MSPLLAHTVTLILYFQGPLDFLNDCYNEMKVYKPFLAKAGLMYLHIALYSASSDTIIDLLYPFFSKKWMYMYKVVKIILLCAETDQKQNVLTKVSLLHKFIHTF